MNLARESVRRKPFGHGIRVQKCAINPFRRGAEHSMKSNCVGIVGCHNLIGFHYYDERGRRIWTSVSK
jgi:hypothetical protein